MKITISTYQDVIKVNYWESMPFKTLGTSVIYSPMSENFLWKHKNWIKVVIHTDWRTYLHSCCATNSNNVAECCSLFACLYVLLNQKVQVLKTAPRGF